MELGLLLLFIGLVPFLYGLFYNFTVFFTTTILIIIAYFIIIKNKRLYFNKNINLYIYAIIVFSYLIVSLWSIDKELAFEGFLRHLSGLIVFIILMQLDKTKKQKIIEIIPYSGGIMYILSLILALIPSMREAFFSENGRLVGFFQYSNSFALFLLIGIVILFNKENKNKKDVALMIILTTGIILTGSRFTFATTIVYTLYCLFKFLKGRKGNKFAIISIAAIIVTICILFMLAQNIRLFKISLNESTLIGRIIYNLDGLKILIEHPFGLGYLGYSYIYPEVQTAVYSVKFVHNDLLQQGLDTGIIPMILLAFLYIYNIFSKNTGKMQRQILLIMFVHMVFDFDLQFAILEFVFVWMIECQDLNIVQIKIKNKITGIIICLALIIFYAYFGVADFADYIDNYKLSYELLPDKTSSIVKKMTHENTIQEAEKLASYALEKNKYIVPAYKVKAHYSLYKENWKEMCENQKEVISLRKYDITQYEELVLMISKALDVTIKNGNKDDTNYLMDQLKNVKQLLVETIQSTSNLAYKIVDKPNLDLNEEILKYLQKVTAEN